MWTRSLRRWLLGLSGFISVLGYGFLHATLGSKFKSDNCKFNRKVRTGNRKTGSNYTAPVSLTWIHLLVSFLSVP